jgi:septum formation protein
VLVLASASARRRELLRLAGVVFTPHPVEVDERPLAGEKPYETSCRLARLKAAAASGFTSDWVLAADTVVALENEIFGKPADDRQAAEMLRRLSGRWHRVYTSVVLLRRGEEACELTSCSEVLFRQLDAGTINWYINSGEPRDKAGAYAIQGKGALLVRAINGSYTNVVGLPLVETLELLSGAGLWSGPGSVGGGA